MQLLLTGFLEAKTPIFMLGLWTLLLSAQSNPLRVPTELLEEKKKEMRDREANAAVARRGEEQRGGAIEDIRRRERENEGRGPLGGRDGRDSRFDPRNDSRNDRMDEGRSMRGGMRGGYGAGDRGGYPG